MKWCRAAWPISFGSQGVERIVIESEFARDSWMAWIWNISRMYFMHSNVVKVHISTLKTFRCSVPLSTYIKMERAYVHKRRSSSPFCFPLLSFFLFCLVFFSPHFTSLFCPPADGWGRAVSHSWNFWIQIFICQWKLWVSIRWMSFLSFFCSNVVVWHLKRHSVRFGVIISQPDVNWTKKTHVKLQ